MTIALSLQNYLDGRGVSYDLVHHDRSVRSSATAQVSGVPEGNLAKGVLIRRRDGYILAVVPASRHVQLAQVGDWLNQPVGLATEAEVARIFGDCELGAIPPVADAYGLPALMDDDLKDFDDVYFEAGDHRTLVHVTASEFHELMANVPHANISARNH